jgi:hypothetical protein
MADERIVIQNSKFGSIMSIVITVLIFTMAIYLYFMFKSLKDENLVLRSEVTEFKKLTDTLVRSSTKWATKEDLENSMVNLLNKEDLKALEKDLNTLNARLTAVGAAVGSIKGKLAELQSSDAVGPDNPNVVTCADGKLVDTHGYTKAIQIKELQDINNAPVANVKFDASNAKPWNYYVYGREYKLATIVGTQDNGQMTFYHKLQYSIPEKGDAKYNIELLKSDYIQAPEKSKMFWFNPIIDMNAFIGGNIYKFGFGSDRANSLLSLGVDVGFSFSSYGPNKVDSWFRLFRLGVGYDAERQGAHFSFAPFAFNIGKPLPLLTNLYLAPQIGLDTAGGLTIGVGVGPQF